MPVIRHRLWLCAEKRCLWGLTHGLVDAHHRRLSVAGTRVSPMVQPERCAARADRVSAGVDELDQWLRDQVRTGIAALGRGGYRPLDRMAARMVDAQAPGVAGMLRSVPGELTGEGWPGRLLEQLDRKSTRLNSSHANISY